MNTQKYINDDTVYTFYFEWETGELKHKKVTVVGYNFRDENDHIIDEYTLLELYSERKKIIFRKPCFKMHKVKGHLISTNFLHAKLKFLHYFLDDFKQSKHDNYPNKIEIMLNTAKTYFDEIIEKEPETILKVITERLTARYIEISYWIY